MGAFEDYVNANLGIRKPLITDSGLPSQSPKAAGIIGSQYVDSDTYFLYEKTGEDNALDWVKIADLGQSRGGEPGGGDGSVQFNSGDSFGGSEGLIYDRDLGLLSGESGRFDYLHSDYFTGQTGHFLEEVIVGNPNLPSSEDVFVVENGDITAAGSANFSGSLKAPTGYFNELIVSGDAHISGDLHVKGTTYVHEIVDTTVSGTVSGYTGIFNTSSGKTGSFTESLLISGEPVLTGFEIPGGGAVIGGDVNNIDFGGTDPNDFRNINFQQGGENVMVIDQDGDVNIQNDLHVSGNISGDIISGKTGVFTETLLSENTLGNNASFTTSLLISGKPVSTGAGGTVGGLPVVGGDQDNIDFGGTEPGDDRPINFQQGGENVMVIDQGGDVNIQNDLHVTGNISGGIISGKTGVFTDSLSVSGVSVLTGNQQASIQWLEDIGGGYLTVKESSVDGINFINTKWIDSAQSNGDIYYDDGQVGIGTNDPQFDIDVNGSANISDVLYIGGVRISGNQDGDLVFG
jgi:cytoskeletal protein CcmA (bactofilin family)